MVTLERLRADLLTARKARDEAAVGLLNPLVGEAAMVGKNAGNRETTPEEVQRLVKKFLDNARETRGLIKGDTAGIDREIQILEGYMPQQMTDDELRAKLTQFKADNPAAKMGDYMAYLKTNFAGQYDGKAASGLVKEVLA